MEKERTDVRGGQHCLPFRLLESHRHHRMQAHPESPDKLPTKLPGETVSSLTLGVKTALTTLLCSGPKLPGFLPVLKSF